MRAFSFLLVALTLSGCLALDGFLYTTERLDGYAFEADGDTPEETVAADQIEPVMIPVGEEEMGAVFVRAAEQPPRAHLIYFQGQGGNIQSGFGRIKRLANMGFDVLAVDYRGWGGSTNIRPTELSVQEDARTALTYFHTRAIDGKIVFYGRSFGAAVATYLATVEAPAVLILESPFASIQALGRESSSLPLPESYYSKSNWDNAGRIGGIDTALLLLHGTADDFVRFEFSEEIAARANEPKKLVAVEGATHGNIPQVMGAGHAQTVRGFVDEHVP